MIDQPPGNWKRGLLNCFIAIHVAALFLWGLPENQIGPRLLQPVRSYIKFSGLWHIWNMFGPGICTIQMDLRARVKYQDGSEREWIAPRMHELSRWERLPKERYRKWRELNFHENFAASWGASARFIARQMNTNPANRPVHVSLTRYWAPTPPAIPNQDFQPRPQRYVYTHSYTYFQCPITVEDL